MPWKEWEDRRNDKVLDFVDEISFYDQFPTETAGDGKIVQNNLRDGSGQGKSSIIRKAPCKQCGYMIDLAQNDHSGGAESVLTGAGGAITTSTVTSILSSGASYVENIGTQMYNKGAGCPLCFSKNSTDIRKDVFENNPWNQRIPPLGF